VSKDDKWIQKAIKKPGALRETAAKHGGINKSGLIKREFLDKAAEGKYGPKTEKRAELAKTLSKLRKK
jgi:hypothetical protein